MGANRIRDEAYTTAGELCPVCGHCSSRPYGGAFLRCLHCGLVFVWPRPHETDLASIYTKSWKRPNEETSETGGNGGALAAHLVAHLDAETEGVNGRRILDFGAGRGDIAAALSARGSEAWAVEPFGHACLSARGLPFVRTIDELPSDLLFDGITMFDVIEHLEDPVSVLIELRSRLVPGGWIMAATPNVSGLRSRLHGQRWKELYRATHITMFTPLSLLLALSSAGFCNPRRLVWFVNYGRGPAHRIAHTALQALRVDGELRMLAFNR